MFISKKTAAMLAIASGMFVSTLTAQADTWYVDGANCLGPGSGTEADPFCLIQDGIDATVNGDTVDVADGTYTGAGNKSLNFAGKLITLRCAGDAGTCIIDCENSGRGFNFSSGETEVAVVDGFTVTGGNHFLGGGMFIGTSSPTVTNCTFDGNSATSGGGMYCSNGSSPTITNCIFDGNSATNGGGMSCIGSSPTITGCTFTQNTSTGGSEILTGLGGGVYCSNSNPTITFSTFSQNEVTGGSDNFTGLGGGLFCVDAGPSMTITDSTFNENQAFGSVSFTGAGAGAFFVTSSPTVTGCVFSGNTASGPIPVVSGNAGGIACVQESSPTFRSCTFVNNQAFESGALSINNGSNPAVIDCAFVGNRAVGKNARAGAMAIFLNSHPTITGCTFLGNTSDGFGGAMVVTLEANPDVTNCLFAGNSATTDGGAVWCRPGSPGDPGDFANPTLINCTFSDNTAGGSGGGVYNSEEFGGNTTLTLDNAILWNNSPDEIADFAGAMTTVRYSDVLGGWPGDGNIMGDPLFVQLPDPGPDEEWGTEDDDYGDLRFQAGSPCIDAANNSAAPMGSDLDGNPRFVDDPLTPDCQQAPGTCGDCPVVDMGAYEYQDGVTDCCPADLSGDGVVEAFDLALLLGTWGPCPEPCAPGDPVDTCAADLSGDCVVAAFDLALLLGSWGPCE